MLGNVLATPPWAPSLLGMTSGPRQKLGHRCERTNQLILALAFIHGCTIFHTNINLFLPHLYM